VHVRLIYFPPELARISILDALNGKIIDERTLVAAKSIDGAGILGRAWDSIKLLLQ